MVTFPTYHCNVITDNNHKATSWIDIFSDLLFELYRVMKKLVQRVEREEYINISLNNPGIERYTKRIKM